MGGRCSRARALRALEALPPTSSTLKFPIPVAGSRRQKLVIEKNDRPDAYVRPIACARPPKFGSGRAEQSIHLAIAAWEWPSYFDPRKLKASGSNLAEYRRPDPATIRAPRRAAGLYMICTISKHKAEDKGYADAMRLDWQGRVRRCTGRTLLSSGRQDPHADRRLLPAPASRARPRSSCETPAALEVSSGASWPERAFRLHSSASSRAPAARITPPVSESRIEVHAWQDLRDSYNDYNNRRGERRRAAEGPAAA